MESTKKDKNGLLPFLKKFITKKIVVFLVSLIIIVIVIFGVNSAFQSDSKTVDIGLRNIGELATQVAYVTEVDVIDDPRTFFGAKIPFTQSHYVYSYDFVIKAGFKVEDIIPDVNEGTKTVTILMPKAEILSNEPKLDSLKIYLEDESIFNQVTMDESNKAFIEMQKNAEKNAISNGLLEGAKENAKTVITGLFADQFDPEEYKYEFKFQ
ncbi:DUF4230 domain-containing protein [Blautia sp. XA-2221]|uniref:DUF4230 domain-containing protein n=1 Tax=Blautia sp. XA-2221 TaxID=2903961 RepID=UPI0023791657|nr:DUF4230 domain-containing protein [Blautia sp. XA-2221]